jgi:hypothetical protein
VPAPAAASWTAPASPRSSLSSRVGHCCHVEPEDRLPLMLVRPPDVCSQTAMDRPPPNATACGRAKEPTGACTCTGTLQTDSPPRMRDAWIRPGPP